ncbi:flagellar FliL protein [Rhodovulum iodosum]|uniref:Flagellar protein FliL n=1 Tax=Rhodovulum iodosum TaxID=68291 RepID=A0ABV3XRH8_9RHOB|nr:flagellar basal body-associated FliL family protein [Rhodovulum robiginosum]RSK30276.1 flagellar basal body-associated FliL family protein [Rhodovulum robiginosum]
MTDATADTAPRSPRRGLLLGLVLAATLGAAAFAATYLGLVTLPLAAVGHGGTASAAGDGKADLPAFVPVDPLIVSLGPAASARHLRFEAELQVDPAHAGEVRHLLPRILDLFNSYLRAVELAELENPAALIRLRAQMLRRVQLIAGDGRVQDLLITEFVLN